MPLRGKRHLPIWTSTRGGLLFLGLLNPGALLAQARPEAGFPRVALMFASARDSLSPEDLARYSMVVEGGLIPLLAHGGVANMRRINPTLVYLWHGNVAYVPFNDAILVAPGFEERFLLHFAPTSSSDLPCDSSFRVQFPGWRFPIYAWNFGSDSATRFRLRHVVEEFGRSRTQHPGMYDGAFLDGLHVRPVWLDWFSRRPMDADCDGRPDDAGLRSRFSASWGPNVVAMVSGLRAAFPGVRLVANDAAAGPDMGSSLASLLNGAELELALAAIEEQRGGADWYKNVFLPGFAWGAWAQVPVTSIVVGLASYSPDPSPPLAALRAAGADFRRLRFALGSALLTGSYFVYDYSTYYGRGRWWYDEFDGGGRLGTGYLGLPTGDPVAVDEPRGPDLLSNGDFEVSGTEAACAGGGPTGATGWCAQFPAGAATAFRECAEAASAGCMLHVARSTSDTVSAASIQLRQVGVPVRDAGVYSLELRARASKPGVIAIQLSQDGAPWTGVSEYRVIPVYQRLVRFTIPLHVHLPAGIGSPPIRLAVLLGSAPPDIWLDGVGLREGMATVYRRDFENGIVLVNTGQLPKTVELGGPFYPLPVRSRAKSDGPLRETTLPPRDGVVLLRRPPPS